MLSNPGTVSHKQAIEKATQEFEEYRLIDTAAPTPLLFLPAAGYRTHTPGAMGAMGETGKTLYYATATKTATKRLASCAYAEPSEIMTNTETYRGDGNSVRCLAK